MTIIDLRGTHGSGKSYAVHRLIELNGGSDYIIEDGKAIGIYLRRFQLAIVGTYDRVCGGCDGIKTADEVCRRVRLLASEYPNVLLEGILVAHTYKRYADLAEELGDYQFVFLDPPYETCIANVQRRRVERGKPPEFDLFHLTNDWHRCKRLAEKFENVTVYESADQWLSAFAES
jgi:hypothetical protein